VTASRWVAILVLAWTVGVVGRPAALAYEVAAVPDGGSLRGAVKFVGTPPKLEGLRVNRNRDVCGDEKASEALVLGPQQAVKGSVILVEGVKQGKKGGGDVVIDTHRCLFVSHVTAAMPGDRLRVQNSDAILHNTHGFLGKPTVFNLTLPHKDQMIDITKRLITPGVVRVVCDAHPHMFGWIVLHDSPYFAVTDARGAFTIDDIPPGTYKATMWHEGFRAKGVDKDGRPLYDEPRRVTKDVTIGPKAAVSVEFDLR